MRPTRRPEPVTLMPATGVVSLSEQLMEVVLAAPLLPAEREQAVEIVRTLLPYRRGER